MAYADAPPSADGGDCDAGEAAEVLQCVLGTAPFSLIAGHLAPELRTIPTREQMSDTLALSHVCGWVGDSPEFIYCDADLAGDSKSTSGVLVCLVGPRTYMPNTGVNKKQTSVLKSTPEAEIVALDHGVAKEGMALASLWQHAIGKGKEAQPFIINVLEDNASACRIVITGNNPNMRYMSRTQRIDISWHNEQFNDGIFRFAACPSHYQGADIFTKV